MSTLHYYDSFVRLASLHLLERESDITSHVRSDVTVLFSSPLTHHSLVLLIEEGGVSRPIHTHGLPRTWETDFLSAFLATEQETPLFPC